MKSRTKSRTNEILTKLITPLIDANLVVHVSFCCDKFYVGVNKPTNCSKCTVIPKMHTVHNTETLNNTIRELEETLCKNI